MYGLPAAGILANKLLKSRLAKKGYFELPHTSDLWKHVSCPISFTLVVDDFGIKYVGKEHADHLVTRSPITIRLKMIRKQNYTAALNCDWITTGDG